ncbi:MAG TPA: hypothetical protein VGV07_21900 [Devosia sp.]|jgi:hypothetical protein|uniref:hypothetical protein n=1 Tax=Devosia sp. TaxID=1871048 RepID=UPI002DDDB8A9|nr:hypothetical protein [Devosia sp.]HEV2517921.1 hypothetical protein [Devosia sp.]
MFKLQSPTLNRRRLLLGLASASAAGATVALAGAAAIAVAESPTLLRLADELPSLEAAYVAALAAKNAAYRRGMAKWPSAPKALLRSTHTHNALERDVAGAGFRRDGGEVWDLWTLDDARTPVEALRKAISRARKDPARPFSVAYFYGSDTADGWRPTLADSEARLQVAERYYAETARIRDWCGYKPAERAASTACEALVAHIGAIMAEPPATMAGVVIHAQALAAFGKVERWCRVTCVEAWPWAGDFAASVLRIAEEAPAKQA